MQKQLYELLIELCDKPIKSKSEDAELILDSNRRSDIIAREFENAGLNLRTQKISSLKPDEVNVIATIKGKEKKEIIICAHHDRIPGTPGADDNASGILSLISLAYSLTEKYDNLPKTLKLISFGGEEACSRIHRRKGLLGSRRYVRYYKTDHVWGVMNLDLCGRDEQLVMAERDTVGTAIYNIELAGVIRKVAYPLGINIGNSFLAYSTSDNRPFAEREIRTVWLSRVNPKNKKWTIYHSRKDSPETINLSFIEENKNLLENVVDYFMYN